MKAQELLEELIRLTRENEEAAQAFKRLSLAPLTRKESAERWSVLECVEHLNRYGDFYIPEISRRINQASTMATERFKSGLLGDYFAKRMLPKDKLNKMKTFASMNPLNCALDKEVLDTFIRQQHELIALLQKAKRVDLNKVKTSISIAKWIKLRLGDTFRVVVYHNLRHIVQAQKALQTAVDVD